MLGANRRSRSEEMLSIPTDFLGSRFIKGRTIRKVMGEGGGGEGNFRATGIFFRYQIPCMNFFQALA